ncbi:SDR family NAD(P)-dependent oxidoreductase [Brevibacillus formosus]|uniref:SDR family NAD(P)-dependent oxidoreductase n=1 Tax=Brevibacillus formosus TaxID=54913 RepID=UPI001CA47C77|nr:SDR family NAD(P)-dependent oxidoreductase [Brevibacillus formosus]MBW5467433.1 SDR family NAD(P)-dependent oxidoreductase [Brevibacillus formosus]
MKEQFLLSGDHPILSNHKVFGQELLPGPAYVDLIYQAFRDNGYDWKELELCHVSIYHPLTVGHDYEVLIDIVVEEKEAGCWSIVVEGRESRDGAVSPEAKRYADAQMRKIQPVSFDKKINLGQAINQAEASVDLEEAYAQFRALGLIHTGMMKAEGHTFQTSTGVLIELALDRNSRDSAEDVLFHPTLLDASCVGASLLLRTHVGEEQQLFLPLYFESFRAEQLIQERCYTQVLAPSVQRKNELLSMTLELFDSKGCKVAEMKNYTMKLVRAASGMGSSAVSGGGDAPSVTEPAPAPVKQGHALRGEHTPAVQAAAFLAGILAERLDMAEADLDQNAGYYEMGMDSPGLLEMVKRIEAKVGAVLPPTLLFEYTTIADLSVYLAEHYASVFADESFAPAPGDGINAPRLQLDEHSDNRKKPADSSNRPEASISQEEDIAIIGMSGRFPGASDLREFWQNLKDGKDCISEIPPSRWDWKQFENLKSPSGKGVSRWGGFIDDPDCFDAPFFRISPREAEIIDPQERIFLETCWEAIEDAGYRPSSLVTPRGPNKRNLVGVFAGVMHKDYALLGSELMAQGLLFPLSLSHSYVANRVSYSLNFHGPSLAVDTLCSASLTAVHMAVESIRRGECEAAIAGGVNLSLHPGKYKTFGMVNMHSSDGYCRTFGKDGDGFTSGEGIGAVVLKPLSAAVKDGDQIYAVIKGSSINHVGAVSGITVPSPVAQAELIEDCLNKANIHPRTISYLEAHGTGTSLGDPIEIQGLVKAYSRYTDDRQYCAIGSVKSNVGHGESAAGVCGLIKVALQMHHKTLVPSLHSAETNPYIDFEQSPFYIQRQLEQWEQPRVTEAGKETVYPRRAGISSFGAYGSNAHVILEEWVPQPSSASGEPSAVIVPLSAKNEDRLKAYADRLARFLADEAGCVASVQEMESQSGLAANILRMVSTVLKVDEQDIDFDQDWSEYGMETAHLSAVREQLLREYEIETDSIDWYEIRSISDAAESLHLILNRNRHAEGGACQEMSLSSIAYTLQTGREAMEERVVFLVSSIRELVEKLKAYADGKPSIPNCWRGQLKKKPGVSAEVAKADDRWFTEGNMAEIAQYWAQGSDIEWGRLYRTDKPRKMHLPAYPFAKNRYWLPVAGKPQDSLPTVVQQVGSIAEAASPTSPQGESSAVIPASNRNAENDANQRIVEAETGADSQDMLRQFTPVWDTFAVEPEGDYFPAVTERIAVFGLSNERFAQIQALYPGSVHFGNDEDATVADIKRKISGFEDIGHFIWVVRDPAAKDGGVDDALITAHNQTTLSCFRFIQALLQSGYGSRPVGLTVITTQAQAVYKKDSIKPAQAGVHGLIGSLAKEYPNWMIRLIDLESDSTWPVSEMFRIPADRKGGAAVYRGREWHRMQLIPTILPAPKAPVYRNGGVYVVIGGAGGIGMVWSEYMIRTYQAQIVWIGRSPMNDAIRTKIHSLSDRGPEIRYWSADASDIHSLSQAYAEIKQRFDSVNGIVHSAMVLNEYSLAEMDEVAFQAALSAKVDVSVRMAQVFREERLDFVLFFSSLISLIKNPQQAHYAAGCVFKDALAHLLAQQWSCSVKVLNWGFWSSDKVEDTEKYRMLQELGIGLIEPEEGMQAIERVLAQPQLQLAVMKTTKPIPVESMNPKEEMKALAEGQRSVEAGRSLPAASERPDIGQLKRENAEKTDEMNGLLGRLLFVQLRQTGLFASGTFDLKQAMAVAGIAEEMYAEWLSQSVAILVELGLLSISGHLLSVTDTANTDHGTVWEQWRRQTTKWREDEKTRAQIVLVETTLKSLPAVLTGKSAATDVLFPNSSMELVEGIYKSNPVADYFNDVVAEAALHVVRQLVKENPQTQIRILEIGAGTGGTSAGVLAKLALYKTHIVEYCYTDLSKMFLLHAKKEYGPSYPFLTYRTFNVEQALAQQGIDAGQYDLVIAANVLHATRNMRTTVRNAKAALKPGGWLLLNEISSGALFTHLTFGLLEGWWLYDDPGIRIPGSPALSPESWQQLLEREGFGAIGFLAQDHHDLGQQIVAAQSDGIIRQSRWEQRKGTSAQQSATQSVSALTKERSEAAHTDSRSESEDSLFALNEQMLQDEIKSLIASQLAETLKLEASSLDMDDSFADYGLDSISGVHIVNTLNERLQIEMKTTILFDYSSINQLAGYLLSAHQEAVVSAFSDRLAAVFEQSTIPLERKEQAVHFEPLQTKASAQPAEAAVSVRTTEAAVKEPIAIIGMSGRFAKSNTLDELWDHLAQGHDLVEEVTRWDLSKYAPKGKPYCNHGSFLDEIDKFDPSFFNISGLEATYMDPQQRMFLEESWKALEDSGYAGQSVEGRACGVYVGYNIGDYVHHIGDNSPPQAMWGNAPSIIPARIAYYLNLQGPAVTVDTACSSSLVSIHLACQGLWTGETEMALAGGVFVQTTPTFYINSNRAGMLSPSGKCHTFDNRADGFVPGEGVGVVVLKRLKDAIADGDHIHGVIKGSGINQDGTTNGITAPSANSQERLEKSVYERFAIHPEQIQMVEAHGTGTRLGDPIEFEALKSAFSHYTDKKQFCAIGTIKTNIGHTTAAAGVASVFKILLSLRNRQIPPSLHYETGNAHIKFSSSPFYVNTEIKDWEVPSGSRRIAATSSFGFSGTNAHMVIEEAPAPLRMHASRPFYLITLSARSREQLRQQAERLLEHCERVPSIDAGNISYTLLVGRRHMNHRFACIVKDAEELKQLLSNWLSRGEMAQVFVSELAENDVREKHSLKRFGNAAIESCQTCTNPGLYLEHLSTAAELYVQGYALNYSQLFAGDSYSRVPLPTYPFAKERYWVSNADYPPQDPQRREPMKASSESLPLNFQRASLKDTSGLLFQTVLTGTEFFLKDHSVRGQKVLPAVAYLEMARAAMTAAGEKGSGSPTSPVLLQHIGWAQPIVVEDRSVTVNIHLQRNSEADFLFEIYTEASGHPAGRTVHCQGTAALGESVQVPHTESLEELQARCDVGLITGAQCYDMLDRLEIDYGAGLRAIDRIQVGKGELLSRLEIAASALSTLEHYVLHPGMIDSALQASIGMAALSLDSEGGTDSEAALRPVLHYALDRLVILGPSTAVMWAWIRRSSGSTATGAIQKLDIDIYDEHGKHCVMLQGLSSGGMTVDPATEAMMEQRTGMKAMQSEQGIQSLYDTLASGKHQVAMTNMALSTTPLMEELATVQQAPAAEWQSDRENRLGSDELYKRTILYLRETLSSYIRMPLHRMDAKTSFSKFGIDSIMALQLTAQLENELGSLPKTLFFEYENIQALSEYLLGHYERKLRRLLAPELTQVITKAASPVLSAAHLSVTPAPAATNPALKQVILTREEISERQLASDIAIIGLSGRYPGADDLDQFWDNLKSGKDCIEEIPADRWQSDKYYDPEKGKPGKSYCQWGGFLKDIDQFDPIFFQLSPLEASYINPQERLFLESVWNTLEQAGYTSQTLEHEYGSKVGVYAGCMNNHYHLLNKDPSKEPLLALSSYSSIANRVSHFFNLKGPSIAVDTMCSSSAVAIHMACESLRKGECELAIAGGVNLSLHSQKYIGLSMLRLAGSHPGSRSFADGDGYLPSEGVGSVLLKPLVKAIEDGDSILAVIKSTAVNHGGQTNGYGVPNPNAQAQLMEESMRQAGIKPESISYIECAANGSSIGDAVEMAAMNKVYRSHFGRKRALPIGSVKSNIGHGEAASGIAQLTKVVLQLKHRQLVPTIGSDTALNPNLRLEETNFRIQRRLEDWQQTENEAPHGGKFPLRAAISSFGAGGTNAHLIVEEYVPHAEEPSVQETENQLFILSAKSRERLKEVVYHVRQYVKRNEELSLDDLAYTLQVGRESADFRLAVTASSREELMAALSSYLDDTGSSDLPQSGSFGLYEGNADGPPDDMLKLLSGKNGRLYLKHLMDEYDVEKLAIFWSKGGDMDWRELYRSRRKGKIVPLLTYPFVKQRCWLEYQPEAGLERTEAEMSKDDEMSAQMAQLGMNGNDAKTIVLSSVALLLGMMPTEIQPHKRLTYYGLSSLHLVQLLAGLQKVAAPSMELPDLLTCETIQDLIDKVQANFPLEIDVPHVDGSFLEENFNQQIIRLNSITDGRPVFWIHGATGGVEVYRSLAAYAKRPFYGIHSFGGSGDKAPEGIVAIASHYVRLVQAIQPEGPYELGGYSLGGMLAYEMTRQLQEVGETVSSLVMLDTMFSPEVQRTTLDQNSIALQTVNMALAAIHGFASTDEKSLLIHRDEIDCDNGFDVFFERLTELAEHRGLDIPKQLLEKQLEHQLSMQQRYWLKDYKPLPLPRPDEVTCYYFRNQSGVFMGPWEPYLTAKEGAVPFDHLPYWEEWVRQIPQIYVMDVEASTHMTMLEEEASRQVIYAFCEKLYDKRPLSARFFQSFYKQHAMFV